MDGSFGLNIVKSRMDPKKREPRLKQQMQCTTATVRSSLARHEREGGPWTTWKSFQTYMRAKYTSTDSGFARYLKLKQVIQKDSETVESYYQRFDEHISRQKEDEDEAEAETNGIKKVNSQYNYMFVDNLNGAIKPAFLRLPEAKDFQQRTLYELRELATRVEESVSHARYSKPTAKSSQSGNHGGNKPSKKFQKSRHGRALERKTHK